MCRALVNVAYMSAVNAGHVMRDAIIRLIINALTAAKYAFSATLSILHIFHLKILPCSSILRYVDSLIC